MASGNNSYGQLGLGLGDKFNRARFEEVQNLLKNVAEITCCDYCTIVRLSNGKFSSCGTVLEEIDGIKL